MAPAVAAAPVVRLRAARPHSTAMSVDREQEARVDQSPSLRGKHSDKLMKGKGWTG